MGVFGTSNSNIVTAIDAQTAANFKATNNLLTLQTNHVEEFFEYSSGDNVDFLKSEQILEFNKE